MDLRRGPVSALAPGELAGRVVLANVPLAAHHTLLEQVATPPRAAVLSGVREPQVAGLAAAWGSRGLAVVRVVRRAGFACLQLEGAQ